MDSSSSAPEELGCLEVSAGKAFFAENSEASNKDNLKDKLGHFLFFLWAISKNKTILSAHALFTKKEISSWSKVTHESCVHPQGLRPTGTLGKIEGPSELTMISLNDTFVQENTAIIDQTEAK